MTGNAGWHSMSELNRQTIALYAKQLRIPAFNQYQEVIRALDQEKGYDDFLISLMKLELQSRMESSHKRKIRAAGFPYLKTMDELDYSRFDNVEEAFLRQLGSCDFIGRKQNIVMVGNPGTGKTHLSIALGLKACLCGMNVRFYTAANLANELIEAQDHRRLIKLERQIGKADLLIVDELSYLTFNRHQSELLFKVIADRSERQSVIVSTNLKFSDWISMFENTTMVTALIDRLTFRSHVLNMNSEHPYRADYAAAIESS
jgi:DNA replication protein DnaC